MQSISLKEIVRALKEVGLKDGDIVNVHSRLHAVGCIREVAAWRIPEVYVQAFREVIGERGTVVVPTYTTAFGRLGVPFVLEESPSEMGVFSEHIRRAPQAMRTLHPIQSLTALGGQAKVLAENHPRWNVGHDTIWDRMLRRGGKVVSVGIPLYQSASFIHQVEFLACVPYLYHKVLRGEVYAGGQRIADDFFLAARYLQYGISYDLLKWESDLKFKSAIRTATLGGSGVWSVPMEAAMEVGLSGLRRDPYYLLKAPPSFVAGEMPLDGVTGDRESAIPRYFLAERPGQI